MNDRTLELPPGKFATSSDPLIGRVLSDQYRVLRKLGEGGAGRVYLAEHQEMGRVVALKVLSVEHVASGQAAQDFLDEATVVGKLGHENIIDIYYGAQTPDGLVFLAMEYLEGKDLGKVLLLEGSMSWDRARPFLMQIASALAAVHDKGIVHRDIKPDNIFITNSADGHEVAKVLDFGVARALGNLQGKTQSVSGTPQYMSPEQTLGRDVDGRSDIYSLGCLLYQMLTGTLPFQADSVIDLMAKQNYEKPQPPRERRPDLDIHPAVERVILRAMEKNPANRYQTMTEMREAFMRMRLTTGAVPVVMPSTARGIRIHDPYLDRPSRRRKLARVALFLAAAASVSLAVYAGTRADPRARVSIKIDPPEAAVFIDGHQVASRSPIVLLVPPGRHQIWGQAPGYVGTPQKLVVEPMQPATVTLNLDVSAATALEVTSEPPGAEIAIDGVTVTVVPSGEPAKSPYTVRRLRPGEHTIELRLGAQKSKSHVTVTAETTQRMHVVLPVSGPRSKPPPRDGRRARDARSRGGPR